MAPIRIGVVGCGNIAQIMHLPHIQRLPEHFTLQAICDSDSLTLSKVQAQYPHVHGYLTLNELLREPIDAVFVLTSGHHLTEITAVAQAGKHMFVEKPVCFTLEQAMQANIAVKQAGIVAMVGYMKRFDPGVQYGMKKLEHFSNTRFAQIELWHPPQERYMTSYLGKSRMEVLDKKTFLEFVQHHVTRGIAAEPLDETLRSPRSLDQRVAYFLLITSGIHDINLLKAFFGEPQAVLGTQLWNQGLNGATQLLFPKDIHVHYTWLFLPNGKYHEQLTVIGDRQRLTLRFPSPYLHTTPVQITYEDVSSQDEIIEQHIIASYEEAFMTEIKHFHECVTFNRSPITSFQDSMIDLKIISNIIQCL